MDICWQVLWNIAIKWKQDLSRQQKQLTYHYLKPTQRDFKPEIFVFHVGTNDLSLKQSLKGNSEYTVTLMESMKRENKKILISSIVYRVDSFKEKVDEVNAHLEEICA